MANKRLGREQVFEPVLAEIAHLDVGRWVADDAFRRFGREDLAAVRDSRYPGCPVDVEARQAVADALGLAGVEAHPDTDLRVVRPRLGRERALSGHGRRDCGLRAVEHDEEGIALGALLVDRHSPSRPAQDRPVPLAQLAVARCADLSLETGRTLDIAEQEGDRPRGRAGRRAGRLGHRSRSACVRVRPAVSGSALR